MRLDAALARARALIGAVDARVLMQQVSGLSAAGLIAEGARALSASELETFEALVARRAAGEPVAYLVGAREFFGRMFGVSPAVLIPRPETEHLIEMALRVLAEVERPRVLDMGTGSGVIAITLALEKPGARVTAVDASSAALEVARDNAARLGAKVHFVESDWFAAIEDARFDLIVANPPYIAANDAHLGEGDLRFEPRGALTDQSVDGLASVRAIIAGAPAHLAAGGWLWLEHGYDQAAACRALLVDAGFTQVTSERDLAGIERASGGRLP